MRNSMRRMYLCGRTAVLVLPNIKNAQSSGDPYLSDICRERVGVGVGRLCLARQKDAGLVVACTTLLPSANLGMYYSSLRLQQCSKLISLHIVIGRGIAIFVERGKTCKSCIRLQKHRLKPALEGLKLLTYIVYQGVFVVHRLKFWVVF